MTTDKKDRIPNAPDLRFPEFSEEWKQYKVCDVLDFYSTNSLSWEQLDYGEQTLLNLHYGLIHVGLPTLVNLKKETLPGVKKGYVPSHYEPCKSGDVAFADASEDTNDVGKAIEFIDTDNKNVVCGLHTIHGRDNKGITVNGFKGYAFASIAFHHQIRRIAQGTKIFSISTKNFSECSIGIPSKNEQEKIAKLLSLVDERLITQSRAIEKLQSLISGITQKVSKHPSVQKTMLSDVLMERNDKNQKLLPVYSVSVSEGVVNQVEYLGRSFAAKDTSNYNVVYFGDIVYTKSPTGDFPFGIVKRSNNADKVAVSPLYGVYQPASEDIGIYLHYYFCSSLNAKNYLHKLIQKGAKNTINITNQRFLENEVPIPDPLTLRKYVVLMTSLSKKLEQEKNLLALLQTQKQFLLQEMFI